MASAGLSFNSLSQVFSSGWDATTDAATLLKEEIIKTVTFVEAFFKETTLTEHEGIYTIKGPFASKFTFTWRELLMLGGIISSVIFATAAFFTGSILTGCIFLIYTVMLIFGSYWLSEWTKNLTSDQLLETAEQLLENSRLGLRTALHTIKELVGQYAYALGMQGKVYVTQIRELQAIDANLEATSAGLRDTSALLNQEVRAIPARLAPITQQMGEVLGQSKHVRAGLQRENDRLAAVNETLEEQARTGERRIQEGQRQLGVLEGQIKALDSLLGKYNEAFRKESLQLALQGQALSVERQRLTEEVGRLQETVEDAKALITGERHRRLSFSHQPDQVFTSGEGYQPPPSALKPRA